MAKKENIGHYNDNFIPEGLEYREEHWEKALEKIVAHERIALKRRAFIAFSCAALLLFISSVSVLHYQRSEQESSKASRIIFSSTLNPSFHNYAHTENKHNNALSDAHNAPNSLVRPETGTLPGYKKSLIRYLQDASTGDVSNNTSSKAQSVSIPPAEEINSNRVITSAEGTGTEQPQAGAIAKNLTTVAASAIVQPNDDSVLNEVSPSLLYENNNVPFITPLAFREDWNKSTPQLSANSKLQWHHFEDIPKWNFSIYAGASVLTDFSSPIKDLTLDPLIGIGVEKNQNRKFSLSSGIEYFSISRVSSPYSQISYQYDINYQKTTTTIETHRLHYLSVPIAISYRPGKNSQLHLGGGISYMVTGNNEISEYLETPSTDTLVKQYRDAGFVKGFKDFTFHAEAGYSYMINRYSSIGATWQYGLTDITRNSYFNSDGINRNSRLLIYFKLNLR